MVASTVEEFIGGLSGWKQETCLALHEFVQDAEPNLRVSIKWSRPVYELNGQVCYIQAHSNHVSFGFWRGAELSDPEGVLEGTGNSMRHVKFESGDEIPRSKLGDLLSQALELDRASEG